ncbi:MAG: hypothetical protein M0030_05000 [Actinomycetota bacterium]|nr:hypothetical protein [Actinomycetota bacterium]
MSVNSRNVITCTLVLQYRQVLPMMNSSAYSRQSMSLPVVRAAGVGPHAAA